MTYDELVKETESLSYRDKFRLAQLLIQLGRKQEEEQNPKKQPASEFDPELIQYVAARLRKLKPSKKQTIFNSIGAMFQFQGGISDKDKEKIFSELRKERQIIVGENGRVTYPEVEQTLGADSR